MTVHDLAAGLDRHRQIDVILLDFSKAFDKVPHQRLAAKLHRYRIRNQTLLWIKSFLADRGQQFVFLDRNSSSSAPVTAPFLFFIYINDLPLSVAWSVRLFADDRLLYRIILDHQSRVVTDRSKPTSKMGKGLADDVQPRLMWTHPHYKQTQDRRDRCPTIYTTKLWKTSQAKYIGVTIDNKLSWKSHVDLVTKRANQTTAFLRRNLSSCSTDVKAKCYKSLVRPQLEYAVTIWDPYTKVEAVQRRAARFCFNDYSRTISASSMMQGLGWVDLQTRRQQNKAAMMYLIVNNLVEIPADHYLTDAGVLTRGHQQRFFVPYCSVNAYKRSFFPSTVLLWNALPASTISAPSLDDFKVLVCADIPIP